MKRFAASLTIALFLFAGIAHADKLAPPQDKLQPLPANVQPAVSESIQRTASPADLQTIQNVQAEEQSSAVPAQQSNTLPITPFAPVSSSDSVALWIALVIAAVIIGGFVWLWKSF
jgi:hypothetical protein